MSDVQRAPGPDLRRILTPSEHGAWALLAAPILLGMLVAPSTWGLGIAVAGLASLMARQPLRLWLGDRLRRKLYPRTAAARAWALAFLGAAAVVLLALAWVRPGFWWIPLAVGLALGSVQMSYDLRKEGRSFMPEIAGAWAACTLAASIALLGGASATRAVAISIALAADASGSILYVRTRLKLSKGDAVSVAVPIAAAALVACCAGAAVGARWLSVWAPVALTVCLVRTVWGLSPWQRRVPTTIVGVQESAYKLLVVAALAAPPPV